MTLARQVDLEETGGGPSGHHATRDEDHPTSGTPDHQNQHSGAGAGQHQQVYSTLLTPTRYIMRSDLYNHKGELDDSAYDTGTFINKHSISK